jgi:hypothetical protein
MADGNQMLVCTRTGARAVKPRHHPTLDCYQPPTRYAASLYPPMNDSRSSWTSSRGPVTSSCGLSADLSLPVADLIHASDNPAASASRSPGMPCSNPSPGAFRGISVAS